MPGKRLENWQKQAIAEDLRKGNMSYERIARKHSTSISTIARVAAAEGLTTKRRRTRAVEKVEQTYSRAKRMEAADDAVAAVHDILKGGGLTPREAREATQALKSALDARRSEDGPDVEDAVNASGSSLPGGALANLKGCDDESAYLRVLSEMPEEDRRCVDSNGVFWDPIWGTEDDPESGMGYPLKIEMGRDLYRRGKEVEKQIEAEYQGEGLV